MNRPSSDINKNCEPKAEAKDLCHKAKAKDIYRYVKAKGQATKGQPQQGQIWSQNIKFIRIFNSQTSLLNKIIMNNIQVSDKSFCWTEVWTDLLAFC